MPYPLSNDDSTDSESGIRFKTTNTRATFSGTSYENKVRNSERGRNYSNQYDFKRNRSKSRDRNNKKDHREKIASRDYKEYRKKRSHRSRTPEKLYSRDFRRNERSGSCEKSNKRKNEKSRDFEDSKKINKDNSDKKIYNEEDKQRSRPNNIYKTGESSKFIESNESSSIKTNFDDEKFGPALPPQNSTNLLIENNEKVDSTKSELSIEQFGPRLPPAIHHSVINSSNQYGPSLPPKFNTNTTNFSLKNNICIGPSLPSKMEIKQPEKIHEDNIEVYGPIIPTHLKNKVQSSPPKNLQQHSEKLDMKKSEDSVIGPVLPSTNKLESEETIIEKRQVIGPILPPHLRTTLLEQTQIEPEILIDETNDESDDDMIGPLPAGQSSKNPNFIQLEERALQMKIDGLNQNDENIVTREEWMLELPQVHSANLGLGPRQFRMKGVPDMSDRSSWTDTPQDKVKKETAGKIAKIDLKKEAELNIIKERDIEQAKIVDKYKKKKKLDKSLVDLHQEKLKKEKGSTSKTERRPFSRDTDLKVNRFDEAQKKSIFKKAQLLDTKFSSGESKFL